MFLQNCDVNLVADMDNNIWGAMMVIKEVLAAMSSTGKPKGKVFYSEVSLCQGAMLERHLRECKWSIINIDLRIKWR